MAKSSRVQSVLSDIEDGVSNGITEACKQFYYQNKARFGPIKEAWLFHRDEDAVARGFIAPPAEGASPERYRSPWAVLINHEGDQMWLHGVLCGGDGEGARGARTILRDAGFEVADSTANYAELHFLDGQLVTSRSKTEDPVEFDTNQVDLPGQRLLNRQDLAKLVQLAPEDTPTAVVKLWSSLMVDDDWIDELRFLTFFTTTDASQRSGYRGFHLVGQGKNHREIWVRFPLPYVHPGTSIGKATDPANWTTEAVKRIFNTVGYDIGTDERPKWKQVISMRNYQPEMIQWISPAELHKWAAPTVQR